MNYDTTNYQDTWKARRVLVTGACGFVGRWLAEALTLCGAHVTGLTWDQKLDSTPFGHGRSQDIDFISSDITDTGFVSDCLRDREIDTVFHLAANNCNIGVSISPYTIFETNIRGTYSVLEACRLSTAIRRIVVSSSREVEKIQLGSRNDGIDHVKSRGKHHPYAVSKLSAELIAQTYADLFSMPIAIARLSNIYGGGDNNWNRLIPGCIRTLLQGEAPVMRSSGNLRRNYLYISDAVRAYLELAESLSGSAAFGRIYAFGSSEAVSAIEVVEQLCQLLGRSDLRPIISTKSEGERVDKQEVTDGLCQLDEWKPKVDFETGLMNTVEWYKNTHQGNTTSGLDPAVVKSYEY